MAGCGESFASPGRRRRSPGLFPGKSTERLSFLRKVGLGYLSLDRSGDTLSGGETQRIRLAAQLGSNLRGVCYILDEPTIGLHPADNRKLLESLQKLRDKGNSVVIVEHDPETMKKADMLVELGPGAGSSGGKLVAMGSFDQLVKKSGTLTGQWFGKPLERTVVDSGPKEAGRSRLARVQRRPGKKSQGNRRQDSARAFGHRHGSIGRGKEHAGERSRLSRACRGAGAAGLGTGTLGRVRRRPGLERRCRQRRLASSFCARRFCKRATWLRRLAACGRRFWGGRASCATR